ncbi:hypothetical protein CWM66_26445 [Kosakonia sp. H7A]|uniref:hypothetical protein n=1 Tax=Kosakonia sp. H7A TaxID=2054598 RepID=UPI000D1568C2|nr:hypothetical protein [Kosakonia sp. H7A]PTA87471.1 hypothetical protein CWM66_26445 [Kosakonia sp. H7A]
MDYYELLKTITISNKTYGGFRFEIFHQTGTFYSDIFIRDKESGRWLVHKFEYWLTKSKTLDEAISSCILYVENFGK